MTPRQGQNYLSLKNFWIQPLEGKKEETRLTAARRSYKWKRPIALGRTETVAECNRPAKKKNKA